MLRIDQTIKSLYKINLLEGEGLGTAYEYFVKLKKLKKFISLIGYPKRIVIFGLPERYGLSMDFFFLGQLLQAEVVAIDERAEVLKRAREVFRILKLKQIFQNAKIIFLNEKPYERFDTHRILGKKFDLALSSEVFQRLDGNQDTYISNLIDIAENFVIFAPNQENESHAKISGLNGTKLDELLDNCQRGYPGLKIFNYGYIDLPPFPPGISRSKEKRAKVSESRIDSILMKGLELYGRFENYLPKMIKRRIAHIVYVMGANQ